MRITRRDFLKTLGFGIAAGVPLGRLSAGLRSPAFSGSARLFVGTYTNGKSEGIYRCSLGLASGELNVESVTKGITNPSFLALDRFGTHLFCVNEVAEYEGKPGGSLSAFALDPDTGDLRLLNRGATHGADPCYVTCDPSGRFVLAANYTGGSIAVLPIRSDGSLGEATDVARHTGSSVKPRQKGPHAHSIVLDPSGRYAYAADLGLDKVMIYRFNSEKGTLSPAASPWALLNPGAGPRHIAFSHDGSAAYVVNELDSTLTAFSVDKITGTLAHRQTLSTVPSGFSGENYPADVHVARSGKCVYVSNRGHDSIAVFGVNPENDQLSHVQHQATGGKWPRTFTIDPTAMYLLVANQRSNTIVVFDIDPESGLIAPNGHSAEVPSPVCLKF